MMIHVLSSVLCMVMSMSPLASGFSLEAKINLSSIIPRNNQQNIPTIITTDADVDIDADTTTCSNSRITSRKSFIQSIAVATAAATAALPAFAEEDERTFTRIKKDKNPFAYTLTLPSPPSPTNKPLQTHLDEVNLPITTTSTGTGSDAINLKGYTYGITVDPIRLNSLREFGTPNEVAAKIVMAELRRDGVLDVTTGRDPKEDSETGAYDVEYISDGSRGRKHFVTRTVVKEGKLYVLTVQCKQVDWNQVEDEVWASVSTFKVLDP